MFLRKTKANLHVIFVGFVTLMVCVGCTTNTELTQEPDIPTTNTPNIVRETDMPTSTLKPTSTPKPTSSPEAVAPSKVNSTTDYEYTIENNEVTITKYIGNGTEVIVPSEIDGRKVISIGYGAFNANGSLTSVVIPDGVVSIRSSAFFSCGELKNVTIPNNVTSIESFAFGECGQLTNITLPSNIKSIDDYVFYRCSCLESINIPISVTSIGEEAFSGTSLTNVIVPDSVTFIGRGAFYGTPWSRTKDYEERTNLLRADGVERMKEYDFVSNEYDDSYTPFNKYNNVIKADFKPTFAIENNYPRLDGATAFYPIYSAVTETVYNGLDQYSVRDYVECNTTAGAYERLINGETDIIFCLEPSQEQLAAAKEKGVNLKLTKISSEAFVFFVNSENTVGSLTVEQIQNIYSKQTTNWNEVDGKDEKIIPFQRSEGSGSQTIMQKLMQDKALFKPMIEEVAAEMGDVIRNVAEYRNYSNAIGYSFRYYVTAMNLNTNIKLLSINGVEPTFENIANGSYPLIYDIYAITTEETAKKENIKLLVDWILSGEGQRLIKLTGYCPIK